MIISLSIICFSYVAKIKLISNSNKCFDSNTSTYIQLIAILYHTSTRRTDYPIFVAPYPVCGLVFKYVEFIKSTSSQRTLTYLVWEGFKSSFQFVFHRKLIFYNL